MKATPSRLGVNKHWQANERGNLELTECSYRVRTKALPGEPPFACIHCSERRRS